MTPRRFAALLGVLTLLPASALAQRPMSIVDLISVPAVSAAQLSPDGTPGGLRAGGRGLEGQQARQPSLAGAHRRQPARPS